MSFGNEHFNKAMRDITAHRERSLIIAENNKNMLYMEHSFLADIDREIANTALKITKVFLKSKDVTENINLLKEKNLQLQRQRAEYISANNIDEAAIKPSFNCEKCEDTGYFEGKVCQCVKNTAARYCIDELNSYTPITDCTFDRFDVNNYPDTQDKNGIVPKAIMSKMFEFCKNYANNFTVKSDSLVFFGATGLGKTHLSLAIANEVIKKGYGVIYGPITHLMSNVEKEHFSRNSDTTTLENIKNCDLLILDDLGTEFTTQFITSVIYDIINTRILNGKPTIINTNLNLEELESKYSDRIVSRISGCYRIFQFFGEDIRAK
ncbi:MAG: ATP-binding protein [Clostridia bacterium]|nr:ATP-binding protein [Clostridia bacterium]